MKKFLLSLAVAALSLPAMAETVTDVLNQTNVGNKGTNYASYTYTGASGAEYALQCAADKGSIQLRSNNNNSGIVVTNSAGNIVKIEIEWNSETADARTLNIYESSTAYTTPTELYTAGMTTVASLTKSAGEVDYTFDPQPAYIGLRSASGAMYINEIKITWDTGGVAPAVAKPLISCTNNMVTISCSTEGADIYYTLDNTDPTSSSTKYNAPFAIIADTTVKAIAIKGTDSSSVTTYKATYIDSYESFSDIVAKGTGTEGTVNGPITAIYQSGQYLYVVDAKNYPMLIYGNIGKTLNNGDRIASITGKYSPYSGLPEFTNPSLGAITTGGTPVDPKVMTALATADDVNTYVKYEDVAYNATDKTITIGDNTLVIYSRFNEVTPPTENGNFNVTGFVSIYNSTVQLYPTAFEEVENVNRVEAPVITPQGGSVDAGTEVTITCATEGASIYYTLDGTVPTSASTLYNSPIAVNAAITIKAIAVKEGMDDSNVATAVFKVIDPNATQGTFNFNEPTTLDPAYEAPENGKGIEIPNVTFTSNAVSLAIGPTAEGKTAPRLWAATGQQAGLVDLRIYVGEYFTLSVPEEDYYISGIEFTKDGGSFALTVDNGTFSVDSNNATWTAAQSEGTRAEGDDTFSSVTFTATDTTRISTITVNYAKIGGGNTTGVETIGVAEGEAVYFNLQGVRVAHPERGIFVKVQNGKAVKVVK